MGAAHITQPSSSIPQADPYDILATDSATDNVKHVFMAAVQRLGGRLPALLAPILNDKERALRFLKQLESGRNDPAVAYMLDECGRIVKDCIEDETVTALCGASFHSVLLSTVDDLTAEAESTYSELLATCIWNRYDD